MQNSLFFFFEHSLPAEIRTKKSQIKNKDRSRYKIDHRQKTLPKKVNKIINSLQGFSLKSLNSISSPFKNKKMSHYKVSHSMFVDFTEEEAQKWLAHQSNRDLPYALEELFLTAIAKLYQKKSSRELDVDYFPLDTPIFSWLRFAAHHKSAPKLSAGTPLNLKFLPTSVFEEIVPFLSLNALKDSLLVAILENRPRLTKLLVSNMDKKYIYSQNSNFLTLAAESADHDIIGEIFPKSVWRASALTLVEKQDIQALENLLSHPLVPAQDLEKVLKFAATKNIEIPQAQAKYEKFLLSDTLEKNLLQKIDPNAPRLEFSEQTKRKM